MQDTTRATAAPARPLTDTVAVEPGKSWRLSWGAILAGAIIVLAVQLLLSLLGAGIGLSMGNCSTHLLSWKRLIRRRYSGQTAAT